MSWHNWAGDQVCQPASVARPGSVAELAEIVAGASSAKVRGSGHSFSEAALTDGVMQMYCCGVVVDLFLPAA